MLDFAEIVKANFKFNDDGNNTAVYGWISKNGVFTQSPTTICHAGLNHPPIKAEVVAVVSQIMGWCKSSKSFTRREGLGDLITREYYKWLLNESPVKDVFITKDVDQAFEDKYLLLSTEHPRNVLMTACIMSRYIWEETKVPRPWWDMVESGIDKDGAFVLAHIINHPYIGEAEHRVSISNASGNINHTIFDFEIFHGTLTNFKQHYMPGIGAKAYKEAVMYREGFQSILDKYSIGSLFQKDNKHKLTDTVKSIVDRKLESTMVEGRASIFGEYKSIESYNYKDLIKVLAEHYPQILEEDAK